MRRLTVKEVTAQYPNAVEAMGEAQQRSTRESRIQYAIVDCLKRLDTGPIIGQQVGAREADIFVTDRQCVIEVKATGQCSPQKTRKSVKSSTTIGPKEEQVQQLNDYVRGLAQAHEERKGPAAKPWWGILTDGRTGWVYCYGEKATRKMNPAKPEIKQLLSWSLSDNDPAEVIVRLLRGPLETQTGKPWAGPDLYQAAFEQYDKKAKQLYDVLRREEHHGLRTKFDLWKDQMQASGLAPADVEDSRRLFCKHTFLVAVAKAVIASLEGLTKNPSAKNRYHGVGEGFTAWLTEHADGRKLLNDLFEEANSYDWQMRQSDVLRNLYQDCVPANDRKLYGEYYTPDWLAEMLAEKVLNESWIERSVEVAHRAVQSGDYGLLDGIGVLDPTCGSGTFLYHAARMLVRAKYWYSIDASSQQIADAVALLVHGIDIHPVAVEMSRATVLRALPVEPTVELQIAQGDSLLIERGQRQHQLDDAGGIRKKSPGGVLLEIPREFICHPRTPSLINDLVTAANNGKPFPKKMPQELQTKAMQVLHKDLTHVCREEGNSVWGWWLKNMLHPHRLAERKINRILANPPWVRMSTIQDVPRKREMIGLAKTLGIWEGRMVATSFDIAALFIEQCSQAFMEARRNPRAAWVTNEAAVRAASWKKWRKESEAKLNLTYEMGELREEPFTGAAAALLINDGRSSKRRKKLMNKRSVKVQRHESWMKVKALTKEENVQERNWKDEPSLYLRGKEWRQGPTVVPYCLLKIEDKIGSTSKGKTQCRMARSVHKPWSKIGPLKLEVPNGWIQEVVGAQAMHPFCLGTNISEFMIPTDGADLMSEDEALQEPCWREADKVYSRNMGKGSSTPKSLWAQVNHRKKLEREFTDTKAGKYTVMYNRAGTWLKSAYGKALLALDDTCWLGVDDEEEAKYLTTVLNAGCLQEAFQAARESDRHFQLHIWRKIPIPLYDERKPLHREIAALFSKAEKVASQCLDSAHGPLKQDRLIREALSASGIMEHINVAVRKLLPKHTT